MGREGLFLKIEGYFTTLKRANEAALSLKESGFNNVSVDNNDHFTESEGSGTNLAGTEEGYSLANLTLKSGGASYDDSSKTPLLAASPMASGMAGFSEIYDINCKVVIECSQKDEEKAKAVIKKLGGELDSPNMNTRKHIKDINMEDIRL